MHCCTAYEKHEKQKKSSYAMGLLVRWTQNRSRTVSQVKLHRCGEVTTFTPAFALGLSLTGG